MLDPLAGSPHELQSGPIIARPLVFMDIATQRTSLKQATCSQQLGGFGVHRELTVLL
jgi:hypothetical protein